MTENSLKPNFLTYFFSYGIDVLVFYTGYMALFEHNKICENFFLFFVFCLILLTVLFYSIVIALYINSHKGFYIIANAIKKKQNIFVRTFNKILPIAIVGSLIAMGHFFIAGFYLIIYIIGKLLALGIREKLIEEFPT